MLVTALSDLIHFSDVFMLCPACRNDNLSGSLTCSKCEAALPPSPATSPATVSSAAQTKAAPLIAGAALAGMGDRAIATLLDLVVVGATFALVGMWAVAQAISGSQLVAGYRRLRALSGRLLDRGFFASAS